MTAARARPFIGPGQTLVAALVPLSFCKAKRRILLDQFYFPLSIIVLFFVARLAWTVVRVDGSR